MIEIRYFFFLKSNFYKLNKKFTSIYLKYTRKKKKKFKKRAQIKEEWILI